MEKFGSPYKKKDTNGQLAEAFKAIQDAFKEKEMEMDREVEKYKRKSNAYRQQTKNLGEELEDANKRISDLEKSLEKEMEERKKVFKKYNNLKRQAMQLTKFKKTIASMLEGDSENADLESVATAESDQNEAQRNEHLKTLRNLIADSEEPFFSPVRPVQASSHSMNYADPVSQQIKEENELNGTPSENRMRKSRDSLMESISSNHDDDDDDDGREGGERASTARSITCGIILPSVGWASEVTAGAKQRRTRNARIMLAG
eukprot:gb/GECH01003499.1/.p1 GENE.gb/GECH01003499.1/~~gb/GECH01003499.1/.p1  ORF type:complete len:260 (+),score=74.55 gb/GECH01003499.1/:1-780(+)